MKPRAVFLDRDGVLNKAVVRGGKPYPPASVDEIEILSGVDSALARLKAAGYVLVVVTNLVDYEYDEEIPNEPDARVASLSEAVEWILTRHC